jgi:hypothetical protein
LLNTIQTERTNFESLIAPLSEAQLCTATLEGQWSIKDILAHIAAWERICTGWLEEFVRGETPHPEYLFNEPQNERIYQQYRDLSLEEVQGMFHHAYQQFLQQVTVLTQAFTTEDLNAPHRFAWTEHAWLILLNLPRFQPCISITKRAIFACVSGMDSPFLFFLDICNIY